MMEIARRPALILMAGLAVVQVALQHAASVDLGSTPTFRALLAMIPIPRTVAMSAFATMILQMQG